MFKLPAIRFEVDCEALGYAGLTVTLLVNPDLEEYQAPTGKAEAWENEFYYHLGRIIQRVDVPGEYRDDGQAYTIEIQGAADVYELERAEGFDPQILQWALRQYQTQRQERLRLEIKN